MAQFSTTVGGIQLHFVWERSDNADAIPLLLLHGWPGSYFEVGVPTGAI
jgi:pimeloyl-ACP methyl ester carboxylesterase